MRWTPERRARFAAIYREGGARAVSAEFGLTVRQATNTAHSLGLRRHPMTPEQVRDRVREAWPDRPDAEPLAGETGYSPRTIREIALELGYRSKAPEPEETARRARHRERVKYVREQVARRRGEPGLYRTLAQELGVAPEATVHWLARKAGVRFRP